METAAERHYAVHPAVASRGATLRIDAEGQEGDLLVSLVSMDTFSISSPISNPFSSGLFLASPFLVKVEGTVPPSESFSTTFPAFTPSGTSLRALFQGVFFGTAGDVTLSEPSAVFVTY